MKLLGAGAMVGVVGKFASFAPTSTKSVSQEASAQTLGSWAMGPNLSYPAIHATILPNGKIMYAAGSGWLAANRFGPYQSAILSDPDTATETFFTQPDDLFCCNFAHLANGNILIAGGTLKYAIDTPQEKNWHGGRYAYEFDINSNTFYKTNPMAHGRWYPSMGTLPDGRVFVMTGLDEYGTSNALTEVYDPVSKTFNIQYSPTPNNTPPTQYLVGGGSILPGAGTVIYGGLTSNYVNPSTTNYSRTILMPSGLVFKAGQSDEFNTWNPITGAFVKAGKMNVGGRSYGTAVLLPLNNIASERGKVLIAGGQPTNGGSTIFQSQIADFDAGTNTQPVISFTNSMTYSRMYTLPVILPTGKVVIFGGTSDSNVTYVYNPEMFDPVDNSWTVLPAATVGRQYHSVAMLLPDGRVWTACGMPGNQTFEQRTEIFSPSYLFAGPRPTISGPPVTGSYGGTITIPSPDAATPSSDPTSIASVSLIHLPNTTHHFDWSHRLVWLQIQSKTSSSVTVSAPLNANIAPPGYYYIFLVNKSGVPSVAKIIQIGPALPPVAPDTTPPTVGIYSPSSRAAIAGPSTGVPVTIAGTAYDTQSGIQSVVVSIDSGTSSPATPRASGDWSSWSFSTIIKSIGPHTIKAVATDNAGNKTSVSIPITIFFG